MKLWHCLCIHYPPDRLMSTRFRSTDRAEVTSAEPVGPPDQWMRWWYSMKKLCIILFLLFVLVGFIANAAKIGNDYLGSSSVELSSLSDNQFSPDSQESVRMDQQGLLTLGLLIGTGLVGLLMIRRKWSPAFRVEHTACFFRISTTWLRVTSIRDSPDFFWRYRPAICLPCS